jgi:hypothetical protein
MNVYEAQNQQWIQCILRAMWQISIHFERNSSFLSYSFSLIFVPGLLIIKYFLTQMPKL